MSPPHDALLAQVGEGDEAATKRCVTAFGPLVWSLARRFLGNSHEAEDAVQEIFVEIWRSAGRYDPTVASEKSYVAMIARRRLIDRLRRRSERSQEEAASELADPTNELMAALSGRDLSEALRQLSAEQQTVLSLAARFGLSHTEISERTGIPLGTVKSHARRGLARLRDLLVSYRGDR